jgi:hypothetical protein
LLWTFVCARGWRAATAPWRAEVEHSGVSPRETTLAREPEPAWRLGPVAVPARLASDLILCLWVILVLAYFSTQVPWKEPRYLMPAAPAWFLLSARGLGSLLTFRAVALRAAAGVALAGAMAVTFAPTTKVFRGPFIEPWISDEKQGADFLNQQPDDLAVLYANFNYPVFAYYTELRTVVIASGDLSFYDGFPANMPEDGYVVLYPEVGVHPLPAWAEVNPHFRRLKTFREFVIYEYRRAVPDADLEPPGVE